MTAAARDLLQAERTATPIEPLTARIPDLGVDGAYAIQRAGRALRLADGGRIAGHKIGLTSEAIQRQLGVDQPDYGYLLDTMIVGDGAVVDAGGLIAPRVEAEIGFLLKAPLRGPGVTVQDVLAATAAVTPCIEVIDSRIRDRASFPRWTDPRAVRKPQAIAAFP